jgi:hypothetical protein
MAAGSGREREKGRQRDRKVERKIQTIIEHNFFVNSSLFRFILYIYTVYKTFMGIRKWNSVAFYTHFTNSLWQHMQEKELHCTEQ